MNQNVKLIAMFLIFASLTTMALGFIPRASAGPATSKLLIKIYFDPVQGENALGIGDIDINSWPLSKGFVTAYAGDPSITMDQYDLDMTEFDLNNQLWPTGPITTPRTGAKNGFFDPTGERDLAALHFRRAIAHLSNKAKYTTTYMGGYGYVMETIVPVPALEGFTDYATLTNDTAKGVRWLTAAAAAGATRIYVGPVHGGASYADSYEMGDEIKINQGGFDEECGVVVQVDPTHKYLDLATPLQFAHVLGERLDRYVPKAPSILTPTLSAATAVGDTVIVVNLNGNPSTTFGYYPDTIQVGCTDWTSFTQEFVAIRAKANGPGPGQLTITVYTPLQHAHAAGVQVFPEVRDPGYLYAYDRSLAIGELLKGAFQDWDGDGFIEWSSNGGATYEELPNMKLWTRLDDPNRRQAGQDLYNELLNAGIPQASGAGAAGLEIRIAERSSCFAAAMVNYDYNIYTGSWSVSADIDFIFDLLHSSMGQYSYATNYPGFKNHDFDPYAEAIKYAPPGSDLRFRAIQAQWKANEYCPIIWLWSASVKGYRTGWQNVVNEAGAGIDNFWSFDLMNWNPTQLYMTRKGPADTIVYGLVGAPSNLNIITSGDSWPHPPVPQTDAQLPDCKILSCIYDSLLRRNPYNLAEEVGALATSWSTTASYPGWEGKSVSEFTVRTGATFHDGTPVKPADVLCSILLIRAAGAGNAWDYPSMMDVDHVQIAGNVVRVFFDVHSAFALHWAGFLPIINKDLWNKAIGPGTPAGYNGLTIGDDLDVIVYPGTFLGPGGAAAMRAYHPWEQDANGNGIIDLKEDGSGPWSYVPPNPDIALTAYSDFYNTIYRKTDSFTPITQSARAVPTQTYTSYTISDFLILAFAALGNVNYAGGYGDTQGWYTTDRVINLIGDLARIANSLTSRYTDTWGTGSGQYNPDADINRDGAVNVIDLGIAGANFGQSMG